MSEAPSRSGLSPQGTIPYEAARQAAWYLADEGCMELAESPTQRNEGAARKTAAAEEMVQQYLAWPHHDGNTTSISNDYHLFEAAKAGSLEDVRAILAKYDHLHPYEEPEKTAVRKRALITRWSAMQILRRHNVRDAELAPEFAGEAYQLPEGFKLTVVKPYPLTVKYSDPNKAISDLRRYELLTRIDSADKQVLESDTPSEALDRISTERDGARATSPEFVIRPYSHTYDVTPTSHYSDLGIFPIERYAHITENPVYYSDQFELAFACPMPNYVLHGSKARAGVPFMQFAQTLGMVMGRPAIAEASLDTSWPGTVALDSSAGKLQFEGGFDAEGMLGIRVDRYQPYPHNFQAPVFTVRTTLEKAPAEERIRVAQRLSAWFVALARNAT